MGFSPGVPFVHHPITAAFSYLKILERRVLFCLVGWFYLEKWDVVILPRHPRGSLLVYSYSHAE